MLITIDRLPERIEAACFAALAGEAAATRPAGADDFLHVAESLGGAGLLDDEDLRGRGMAAMPLCGPPGLLLRALPLALLTPLDRPRLRRDVQRCVSLAAADQGAVMASVAAALLVADLLRFDLGTALLRLRQTLLEEAPRALLEHLRPLDEGEVSASGDEEPLPALQVALTVLVHARGVPEAVTSLSSGGRRLHTALTLAGVLAAARDGLTGADEAWLGGVPHRGRASVIARALASRAVPQREM